MNTTETDILPPKPQPPSTTSERIRRLEQNGQPAKSLGEISDDALVLMAALKSVPIDTIISYDHLSGLIHRNVQKRARYVLETARRRLVFEEQILFDCVHSIGLKRIIGESVVGVGGRYVRQMSRTASKTGKKLGCVGDVLKLGTDDRHRHTALATLCATIRHISKTPQVKKLAAVGERVSVAKALELFQKTAD